ncbi:MAG: ComEC/Rec2 family competence protein [Opitutus sp.]
MPSRSLGHRAPLLWLVLPLMAGLATSKVAVGLPTNLLLSIAVSATLGAVVLSFYRPSASIAAVCLGMFAAGAATYGLRRARLPDWDQLPPREARLLLRIDRTFGQRDPRRVGGLATIVRAESAVGDLLGQRIYFSFTLRKAQAVPIRSAVVATLGVLTTLPRDPPGNTFDAYLADAGINFRLARGRILSVEQPPSQYYQFCADQAARFTRMLGVGVEAKRPELVGVLRAMLLGQQHELSEEQVTLYRETGTMHVFSISGLHIAVIATGLHALLSMLRLPRAIRFPVGLVALWLYVDITGAAPSAVRAFVMVAVVEIALVWRLPRNPLSALAASALVILLFDPLQLFSASFQMSYGIVAALLLLGLPLSDCWQEKLALFRDLPKSAWGRSRLLIDTAWRSLLSAAAIGTAASLVSALTGLLFFNLFTPGAFLANLWLIPASSAVIYFGMLSLISGLVGLAAGSALANHAALVVLWLIEAGIRLSVRAPGMWVIGTFRVPWLGSIALAALLGLLLLGYALKWGKWNRFYWAPFTLVALTLLLGVTFT